MIPDMPFAAMRGFYMRRKGAGDSFGGLGIGHDGR